MKSAAAVAEASENVPPKDPQQPAVAASDMPRSVVCPETGRACSQTPICGLIENTGSVYCALWVTKVRTEEIKRRGG